VLTLESVAKAISDTQTPAEQILDGHPSLRSSVFSYHPRLQMYPRNKQMNEAATLGKGDALLFK
jgi:hypothetical protein